MNKVKHFIILTFFNLTLFEFSDKILIEIGILNCENHCF
jgi:hypothetical protein